MIHTPGKQHLMSAILQSHHFLGSSTKHPRGYANTTLSVAFKYSFQQFPISSSLTTSLPQFLLLMTNNFMARIPLPNWAVQLHQITQSKRAPRQTRARKSLTGASGSHRGIYITSVLYSLIICSVQGLFSLSSQFIDIIFISANSYPCSCSRWPRTRSRWPCSTPTFPVSQSSKRAACTAPNSAFFSKRRLSV